MLVARLERFAVHRHTGADIVADIGDMNAQLKAAVLQLHQADRIVDILGLGAVDRKDRQAAQVHAVGCFGRVDDRIFILCRLLQHLGREVLPHIAAIQDRLRTFRGIFGRTETLGHGGAVVGMARAAVGQQRADLIPDLRAVGAVFLQNDMHAAAAVRLHRQAAVLGRGQRTGKAVVRGDDLGHFAFGAALHARAVKQLDEDLVLRHCAMQRAPRDKDIAGAVVNGWQSRSAPPA